jgi:hypothetical protein
LPLGQRWQRTSRRGWVLGANDDIRAYLHILSGPTGHVVNLLLHPDQREMVAEVVRFGLAQLHDDRPVYFLLPEYQLELLTPVENLGFQPVSEQTRLLKSTTVLVRKPVFVSAFEPTLEPQITVPHISVPGEDKYGHAKSTRDN